MLFFPYFFTICNEQQYYFEKKYFFVLMILLILILTFLSGARGSFAGFGIGCFSSNDYISIFKKWEKKEIYLLYKNNIKLFSLSIIIVLFLFSQVPQFFFKFFRKE